MEKKEERPWCMITEMDQYLFGQGTHYEIYKKLGAHLTEYEGEKGVYFAVWAPHAKGVRVVGEFNCWGSDGYRMNRLEPLGIYEVFVPGLEEGGMLFMRKSVRERLHVWRISVDLPGMMTAG